MTASLCTMKRFILLGVLGVLLGGVTQARADERPLHIFFGSNNPSDFAKYTDIHATSPEGRDILLNQTADDWEYPDHS